MHSFSTVDFIRIIIVMFAWGFALGGFIFYRQGVAQCLVA
jgi:hypothetical protein